MAARCASTPRHAEAAPARSDRRREGAGRRARRRAGPARRLCGFRRKAVVEVKCQAARISDRSEAHGKTVAGYGAPAKGNTLLNYCGIGPELLPYTVDLSPHKQGRYLPGVDIPIHPPQRIFETRPDYVLILPWNLKDEIGNQMAAIRDWGGRFVVAIPSLTVLD